MKIVLICSLFLLGSISKAETTMGWSSTSDVLNFAAPIIANHTTLSGDVPFGAIVFDNTAGYFMGLSNSGTWVQLSNGVGTNSVVSGGVGERSERVSFGGSTNPSNCTSSPCTIYSQSGSWVSSVTRNSAGNYTVNFNASIWSAAPTCIVNCQEVGNKGTVPSTFSASSSSIGIACFDSVTVADADAQVNIICQGSL